MTDFAKMAEELFGPVRDYVKSQMGLIGKRIDKLEAAQPIKGDKGDSGDSGRDGVAGLDGKDGAPGKDGEHGANAPAPTEADIAPIVERHMATNRDVYRGEKGEPGQDGKGGSAGLNGKDGADGLNGKDGIDGRHGIDGHDAMQLDILGVLDPEKRYQRGTTIAHAGGLIFATRATDAIGNQRIDDAGWLVILNGISAVESVVEGEGRKVTRTLRMTNGATVVEVEKRDIVLDRGVFRFDEVYEKGDHVSYGGSGWISQRSTELGRPGLPDSGWRLSTKSGRDGKDGMKGDKGDKGDKGRDLL